MGVVAALVGAIITIGVWCALRIIDVAIAVIGGIYNYFFNTNNGG